MGCSNCEDHAGVSLPFGISNGLRIVPFGAFTQYTPVIPKFYYDVYDLEERDKHVCKLLQKLECYSNYLAENIERIDGKVTDGQNSIEGLLKALSASSKTISVTPGYVGMFTAWSGKYFEVDYANGETDGIRGYMPQGMTIGDCGSIYTLLRNNSLPGDVGRVCKADLGSHTYDDNYAEALIGHGNSLTYSTCTNSYYVMPLGSYNLAESWGFAIKYDRNFRNFEYIHLPESPGWLEYDKARREMFFISKTGSVYSFNEENVSFTKKDATISFVTDSEHVNQGGAVDSGIFYRLISSYLNCDEIQAYDLATGKHIATYSIVGDGDFMPYGELEDISFAENGDLYISSALYPQSGTGENATCVIFKFNPYTGEQYSGTFDYTSSTRYKYIVRNSNDFGYLPSNVGNSSQPVFTALDQALLANARKQLGTIVLHAESSTTNAVYKCFIDLEGQQVSLNLTENNSGLVIIEGRIAARSNSILNLGFNLRMRFPKYSTSSKRTLITCNNSTITGRALRIFNSENDVSLDAVLSLSQMANVRFNGYSEAEYTQGYSKFLATGNGNFGGYGVNFDDRSEIYPHTPISGDTLLIGDSYLIGTYGMPDGSRGLTWGNYLSGSVIGTTVIYAKDGSGAWTVGKAAGSSIGEGVEGVACDWGKLLELSINETENLDIKRVIIAGGYNDGSPSATIDAERLRTVLNTASTMYPNAKIYLISLYGGNSGNNTTKRKEVRNIFKQVAQEEDVVYDEYVRQLSFEYNQTYDYVHPAEKQNYEPMGSFVANVVSRRS